MDDKERGLYPKYYVQRNYDGDLSDVDDWVFVLNPIKDAGAVVALRAYIAWAYTAGYEKLADDLAEKLDELNGQN